MRGGPPLRAGRGSGIVRHRSRRDCGESAGAHLAALTLLRVREEGLTRQLAAAVLTYGCFDLRMTPSVANWGDRLLVLSTPVVEWFIRNFIPDGVHLGDPAVSPLLADLSDMPPALFSVGTVDPLLDDSVFMASRWAAAGAEAELGLYPGESMPLTVLIFRSPESIDRQWRRFSAGIWSRPELLADCSFYLL